MVVTYIEKKKLKDLNPATYNPRRISDQALKGLGASIERFGCVELIVWNKRSGNIVSGHQRFKVLQKQGVTETEVVVVDLNDIEEKALNVTMNNRHISGEFTADLQTILDEISAGMPDMNIDLNLEQLSVMPPGYDVMSEWVGMPEYEGSDKTPYRQIIVSFETEEDVQDFAELLGQQITDKTKSLRFPPLEKDSVINLKYVDGDKEQE